MATLFNTFATAQSAAGGRYGGTGLNLAVCHQLCRVMDGSVDVRSAPGAGTTITVTMPLAGRRRPEDGASAAGAEFVPA